MPSFCLSHCRSYITFLSDKMKQEFVDLRTNMLQYLSFLWSENLVCMWCRCYKNKLLSLFLFLSYRCFTCLQWLICAMVIWLFQNVGSNLKYQIASLNLLLKLYFWGMWLADISLLLDTLQAAVHCTVLVLWLAVWPSQRYSKKISTESKQKLLNAGLIGGVQCKEEMNKKIRLVILSNEQLR